MAVTQLVHSHYKERATCGDQCCHTMWSERRQDISGPLTKKKSFIKLSRTSSVDISERSQQCSEDAILAQSVFRLGSGRLWPCSSLPLFKVMHMVTKIPMKTQVTVMLSQAMPHPSFPM